jgi:hypothetical protein
LLGALRKRARRTAPIGASGQVAFLVDGGADPAVAAALKGAKASDPYLPREVPGIVSSRSALCTAGGQHVRVCPLLAYSQGN